MSFQDWDESTKLQFIGQELLNSGFKKWFLFFFKTIEKTSFIIEPIHQDLFDCFENVYNLKSIRQVINIPPRAGKTTLAIYFIAYCFAKNPACQFIYTSYSQELLGDNSRRLGAILQSNIYQQMYLQNFNVEDKIEKTIDSFWDEYYRNENKEFKITSRKITTNYGGCILFSSMGSQITGFGFSTRNSEGFTGSCIVDDGNKPNDIRSKRIRQKTQDYYNDVLLTRANNSNAPIINIQQRLHIDDLSGYLLKEYNFNLLKKPLVENGICLLPKQYNENRLKELQKENARWLAQYQQEPIADGGNLIKSEWFKRYIQEPKTFNNIFITCDTAYSIKTTADNSVFSLWGILDNNLYLLDLYKNKMEFPSLKRELQNFYLKSKNKFNNLSTIYIEDKASGQSLLQELKDFGLPIRPIYPTITEKDKEVIKNKYWRCQEVLSDIIDGFVYIPENAPYILDFIQEIEVFSGDDSTHDDQVDCLLYALKIRRNLLTKQVDWSKSYNAFQKFF